MTKRKTKVARGLSSAYKRRAFTNTRGSRAQVFHGTRHHTVGGLTKADLIKNKRGRIVPKSRAAVGKTQIKFLEDLGYCTKPRNFQLFPRGRWSVATKRRVPAIKRKRAGKSLKFCGPMNNLMGERGQGVASRTRSKTRRL